MKERSGISGYLYQDARHSCAHAYLMPALTKELAMIEGYLDTDRKELFELGCGNGSVGAELSFQGWGVTGVDPSVQGIQEAQRAYPHLQVYEGSAYDHLAEIYGRFPVVISLEVVEHVYAPRDYARTLFDLTEPGGWAMLSTPYHGYFKNLALAITGKMDDHFTALWDHGHIKFWSMNTLETLLKEVGFSDIRFRRVGRIRPLAKSMIAVARKP